MKMSLLLLTELRDILENVEIILIAIYPNGGVGGINFVFTILMLVAG